MTVDASNVLPFARKRKKTFERAMRLPQPSILALIFTAHLFSRLARAYLKKFFWDIGLVEWLSLLVAVCVSSGAAHSALVAACANGNPGGLQL